MKMGKSSIPFDDKSDRSKRKEVATLSLANKCNSRKILLAASHAARKSGNNTSAYLNVLSSSPERSKKIRKILEK